jgi:hypothetical protein
MNAVRCADTPQEERTRDKDQTEAKRPETVLGLHDSSISSGEFNGQPIAEPAGKEGTAFLAALKV